MGFSFDAINNISSERVRFFFHLEDFEKNRVDEIDTGIRKFHLGPGNKLFDWYVSSLEKTELLYSEMLELATDNYVRAGIEFCGPRQVEILVGHVYLHLAKRLARSLTQLDLIDPNYRIQTKTIEYPSMFFPEAPKTTAESMEILMSDNFGNIVDALATCLHFGLEFPLGAIATRNEHVVSKSEAHNTTSPLVSILSQVRKIYAGQRSKNSISMVDTYLSRSELLLLSLFLRQLPEINWLRAAPKLMAHTAFRQPTLAPLLSLAEISRFLSELVVPTAVREDFYLTLDEAYSRGLPKRPQVIFTSGAFFYDDVFKVHAASAVNEAVYVVGQHGNNYGVSELTRLNVESRTADHFLSWGWVSGEEKTIKFGQLKKNVTASFPRKFRGVTLLLRDESHSQLEVEMSGPNIKYFQEVVSLCESLNSLGMPVVIQPHSSASRARIDFLSEAIRSLPTVTLSSGTKSIDSILKSGMGVVFTYDSTGMLEMGTAGIPFFSFVPDGLDLVRPNYRKNYEALVGAGLLSERAEEASVLISKWAQATKSERRMHEEAVRRFIEGISFYPKHKVLKLGKILKDARAYTGLNTNKGLNAQ